MSLKYKKVYLKLFNFKSPNYKRAVNFKLNVRVVM